MQIHTASHTQQGDTIEGHSHKKELEVKKTKKQSIKQNTNTKKKWGRAYNNHTKQK